MRRSLIKPIGVLSLLTVIGCTSKVTRQELVGVFFANLPNENDTLDLREDGTYVHSFSSGDTSASSQGGRWMIEPESDGETRITFDHFVLAIGPHKSSSPGFWPASAEKRFGKVRLIINDDMGLYYAKK